MTRAPSRGRIRYAIVLLCVTALFGVTPAAAQEQEQAQEPAVVVTRNLEIPVSSGNVLRGDLYVPVVDGQPAVDLPTVVTYFPYVKDDETRFEITAMHRFAAAGYAGLLVDIAGTGVSPGEFGFLDEREISDGRDVVEWAANQDFSNGRVGMWGYSYPGLTAALVAATRPASLRAVVPASIYHDAYRDVVFPGGILTSQEGVLLPFLMAMTLARQRPGTDPALALEAAADSLLLPGGLATLAEAPTHTTYDAYWQERAVEDKIGQIEVPTLLWSGWADIYSRATLLNRHDIGAEHVRMVMGPWGHLAGAGGEPLALLLDESLRWFETFLREDPSPDQAAAVSGGARIFDVDWGSDEAFAGVWPGEFVELPAWPPSTEPRALALCSDRATPDASAPWLLQGRLGGDCPNAGSLPVLTVPIDLTGGGAIGHDAVADSALNVLWDDLDQRLSPQSTAFLTDALDEDTVITGPMSLSLTATTTGVDTDWVARVVDIGPDSARVISKGWLRAARRSEDDSRPYLWHTHDRDDLLTPGEPYEMTVEIWPTSYRIPAGHRLGVLVRTADTLKVTPTVGAVESSILTGPGTNSSLTIPIRAASATEPTPAPVPAGNPAPDIDSAPTGDPAPSTETGATKPLADTGAGSGLGLGVLLVALAAVLHRRTAWRSRHGPGREIAGS